MSMTSSGAVRLAFAAVACATFCRGSAAHADEVDDLFKRGRVAFDEGRYNDAETSFEKAFVLRKSPDIAANLAQAEIKLNKKQEAANHLAYALRILPASAKPAVKAEMRDSLTALDKELGRITIVVSLDVAAVSVGEEAVGTSPIKEPWYVEPGIQVNVSASLAGHEGDSKTTVVEQGKVVPVELTLLPLGSGKPAWVPIGLGAVGGVLLLGGGGLLGAAFAIEASAEDEAAPGACTPGAAICEDVRSQLDTANGLGVAGLIGMGLGAASLVGMGITLAVSSEDSKNSAVLELTPVPGGLVLKGSF